MLKHPGLDAVVLATPHSLHVQQVIAAAQAGKHVFCEKPFALHARRSARGGEGRGESRRHAGLGLQPPLASGDDEAAQA